MSGSCRSHRRHGDSKINGKDCWNSGCLSGVGLGSVVSVKHAMKDVVASPLVVDAMSLAGSVVARRGRTTSGLAHRGAMTWTSG